MKNRDGFFEEIIYAYTRKQAIEDGVLIDVSAMAEEAGIRYPVAVTSGVYYEYIVPDKKLEGQGQSVDGRLWDLLWMFRWKAQKNPADVMIFSVFFMLCKNSWQQPIAIKLKAVCGPGDKGEPVITIMKPDED